MYSKVNQESTATNMVCEEILTDTAFHIGCTMICIKAKVKTKYLLNIK